MRFPRLLVLPALLVCVVTVPLLAAIDFETTELVVKPVPGGPRKLTGEFKFKNTGVEPVTITEVHSSCGCTVPETPKEPVAPGGSGVIPVTYSGGDRQGKQTQHIQVKTSDGNSFELRLVAELPVRVSFSPRLLLLGRSDNEPKTATVTFSDDLPVTLTEVVSQSAGFEFVEPPKLEDNVLKIAVRYSGDAAADSRGVIRIRTKTHSGAEYTDVLYVRYTPVSP
jgi:hypothetical protein